MYEFEFEFGNSQCAGLGVAGTLELPLAKEVTVVGAVAQDAGGQEEMFQTSMKYCSIHYFSNSTALKTQPQKPRNTAIKARRLSSFDTRSMRTRRGRVLRLAARTRRSRDLRVAEPTRAESRPPSGLQTWTGLGSPSGLQTQAESGSPNGLQSQAKSRPPSAFKTQAQSGPPSELQTQAKSISPSGLRPRRSRGPPSAPRPRRSRDLLVLVPEADAVCAARLKMQTSAHISPRIALRRAARSKSRPHE